jgi:excisionase family DNA binding protein
MSDMYWTVKDTAARLKVNEETVRRWLRSGKLKGESLGDAAGFRVSRVELDAFLRRQRMGAQPNDQEPHAGRAKTP